MSQRLQVLLEEAELDEIRRTARRQGVTVAHWVRNTLRGAIDREPDAGVAAKLAAVRRAAKQSFPTADIEQMNAEIDEGYRQ